MRPDAASADAAGASPGTAKEAARCTVDAAGEKLYYGAMNSTLENRVQRLEKANRWLIVACVGLLTLASLIFLVRLRQDDAEFGIVEARAFELVDENGERRASLGTSEYGSWLQLYDGAGQRRIELVASGSEWSHVSVIGKFRRDRAMLVLTEEGSAVLVGDETGKLRGMLACYNEEPTTAVNPIDWTDGPLLPTSTYALPIMLGDMREVRRSLAQSNRLGSVLGLLDGQGRMRLFMKADVGSPFMIVQDEVGKVVHRIPPDKP
ncbi:MAG: hypothetical protein IH851_04230 [Armatimonadetes bacterium]|nr:hypothetical protein [Armatimonadota bacterium]